MNEVKTDRDITDRLYSLLSPVTVTMQDARCEIKNLRDEIMILKSLIAEWADAEDVMNTVRLSAAHTALRKTVGR